MSDMDIKWYDILSFAVCLIISFLLSQEMEIYGLDIDVIYILLTIIGFIILSYVIINSSKM